MAGKTVAVYDSSESYIQQFLKYVNRRNERWLEVTGFTDTEALQEFLDKKPLDLLLFSMEELVDEEQDLEERYMPFIGHHNVREFVYFGERRNSKSKIRHINKYQSAKMILEELKEILFPKQEGTENAFPAAEEGAQLIGVYDPAGGGTSVSAALELAEELSVQKETLLLDFDRFPMIAWFTGFDSYGSLSDLIYYYKTNPQKLKEGLDEKKRRYHNLDFLTGPEDREDMKEMKEEEWPGFLKELARLGGYDAVVVYMGEAFSDLESFFDHCAQVFVPVHTDEVSTRKLYSFARHLNGRGRQDLFGKIQNLYVPAPEESGKMYAGG